MTYMCRVAKFVMKRFESFPVSPEVRVGEYGEVFQHNLFLNGSDDLRERIMIGSSISKYENELRNPLDHYFDIKIGDFLKNKKALDLGCFTGGRSVAWFERYDLKFIVGVDISQTYVDAAKKFAQIKGAKAEFRISRGEKLPFSDGSFDAILSYDVLEHVQDLETTLKESFRILKTGGKLIAVFPGFFHPLEHHLSLVTKAPAIHYFFNGNTLVKAYHEICEERGVESHWYKRKTSMLEPWERGNTINGTTIKKFRKVVAKNNWRIVAHCKKPIGFFVAKRSGKKSLRLLSFFGEALIKIPVLEEALTNRIAIILEKLS